MATKVLQFSQDATTSTIQLILDNGNTIQVKIGANIKLKLDAVSDLTYIYDDSQSNIAIGPRIFEPNYYIFDWQTITSPVSGNNDELFTTLLAYMPNPTIVISGSVTVAGVSTAAKQDIQTGLLTDIKAELLQDAGLNITGWLRLTGYASSFGYSWSELLWRSQMGRPTTLSTPLTTGANIDIAVVTADLATAIQSEIQARNNNTILDVQSGIVNYLVGAVLTFKGWAIVTYQSTIV